MPSSDDKIKKLKKKIMFLETQVKHLTNELLVTRKEYETAADNYFEIYSNMGRKVEEQAVLLQSVLDNIPAYVYWKNKDQIYLGCNRKQSEFFGLRNPEGIVGKTDYEIRESREDAASNIKSDRDTMEKNVPEFYSVHPVNMPDGRTIWMESSRIPLVGSEGNVIGMLGISEDISERIKNEREQKKNEHHFQQMQRLQSLGVLAGGIAHDFNNILTPIIGFAEMGLEDVSNAEQIKAYLELILKGSHRAKELVRQILAFSRRGIQKKEPIQLDAAVKDAVKFIKSSLPSNISIELKIEDGFVIMADPTQIHQVIINLCTNAFYAMKAQKGGLLKISLSKADIDGVNVKVAELKPGPFAELKVSDNGIGIDSDVIEHIFDPFFTTKKVGEGTGMGLSVAHGIIKSLDGHIAVESVPGSGACFSIYIPLLENGCPLRLDENIQPLSRGNGEKILFVDDEIMITRMMAEMLKSLGYVVTVASDGMMALEIFRKAPSAFDMVMTDLSMPIISGAKLAEELVKMRPDMPVIICSGFGDASMLAGKSGAVKGFLAKPLSINETSRMIRSLLDARTRD